MVNALHKLLWGRSDKVPTSTTVLLLIQSALAHFDVLKPLVFRDLDYANSEGFDGPEFLSSKVAIQHARINRRRGILP
jgi:hypothetical protein